MKLQIKIGLNTFALFAYFLAIGFIVIASAFFYFAVYKTYYENLKGLDGLLTRSETFDIEKIDTDALENVRQSAKNKGKKCVFEIEKSPFK